MDKYIIEVRDKEGKLDFRLEEEKRKEHPYLFKKETYTIDELCGYASRMQEWSPAVGPMSLGIFMTKIGIHYRVKYW